MKTKQIALTLMFFLSFALFFAGCATTGKSSSKRDKGKGGNDTPTENVQQLKDKIQQQEREIERLRRVVVDPPPPPGGGNTVSADLRYIPVTLDVVKNIKNSGLNLRDLNYYLSKSFAMTIIDRKDTRKKLEIKNGVLISPPEQKKIPRRIEFPYELKGTMSEDWPESSEIFVIVYKEVVGGKDIPLTFKRNPQGRYDLVSALIDKEPRTVDPVDGGPPQLCIMAELNENLEMLAFFNSKYGNFQSLQFYEKQQSYEMKTAGTSRLFDWSPRRIDDTQSSVTKAGITKYVRDRNPNVNRDTLSELIRIYEVEAGIEGVNLDIAIAQMLYTTNYLDSKNQRVKNHNYGGLNEQTRGWNGKFPRLMSSGMDEGVRAHIQHLKGYVSRDLARRTVDPRYHILKEMGYWGQVKTFDQLYRAWSPNKPVEYANSINRILDGLKSASGFNDYY